MHIKPIPVFSIVKQLLKLFTDNTSAVTFLPFSPLTKFSPMSILTLTQVTLLH